MKIKINDIDKIQNIDISMFEKNTGLILPKYFREFVIKYNGGTPSSNVFIINENYDISITKFISIKEMMKFRNRIENIDIDVFPIAIVEGGNYLLINLKDGSVTFWDHEEPFNKYLLANNINDFLLKIEPFDIESVDLSDDQVVSAWIDPEFLKIINKE